MNFFVSASGMDLQNTFSSDKIIERFKYTFFLKMILNKRNWL